MRFDSVCFSYPDREVFHDFSMTLPDTGITALSGPSGCGKTTLLRLLAGLEKPASGTIAAPDSRDVAMLFQENRLIPKLSAIRQIQLVLPKDTPRAEALKWLDAVGLSEDYDTPPEALSGGMQRRVSLARCLAYGQNKKLILLDEPFTGVDAERTGAIMKFIRGMGVPVLFSSHEEESLALADRIIAMAATSPAE